MLHNIVENSFNLGYKGRFPFKPLGHSRIVTSLQPQRLWVPCKKGHGKRGLLLLGERLVRLVIA